MNQAISFIITLLIELPIFLVLAKFVGKLNPEKKGVVALLGVGLVANAFTQPIAELLYWKLDCYYNPYLLFPIETFVVVTEAWIYLKALKIPMPFAFGLSLLINGISFGLGFLM